MFVVQPSVLTEQTKLRELVVFESRTCLDREDVQKLETEHPPAESGFKTKAQHTTARLGLSHICVMNP